MAIILSFYALVVLAGIVLARFVGRRLRRFGRIPAVLAGLGCLGLGALCFPIPIHGGFTTVAEMLLHELGRQRSIWRQQGRADLKAAFFHRYELRFAGELSYQPYGEEPGDWLAVTTEGGQPAWLDREHRLLWSVAFSWQGHADFSLEKPKAFCRQLPPAGYWSLPSTAELALFWQGGGAQATGGPAINAASFSVDETLLLEVPNIHLGTGGQSRLRCVARAPGAPLRGYLDKDIPLDLWNRYQLAKSSRGQQH